MNFDLSEDQKMLRDAAQKFLRTEYRFDARNQIVASASGMSREHWQRFGEFGWLGLGLPEAHGGFGGAGASISATKQQRIIFAARHYLMRLSSPPPCRFDVVLVEDRVQWLKAAFDTQ